MSNPFENLRGSRGDQDRSSRWYIHAVNKFAKDLNSYGRVAATDLGQLTGDLEPGNMYMYVYDPKHKKTLPYYDRFPLCMPFETNSRGFTGLNLHYLAPMMRARLLGSLIDFASKPIDSDSKFQLSWELLSNFSRFPGVQPTVKRYLYPHVKSRFLKVNPEHWRAAIFLPTQKFVGASDRKVYTKSKEIVNA